MYLHYVALAVVVLLAGTHCQDVEEIPCNSNIRMSEKKTVSLTIPPTDLPYRCNWRFISNEFDDRMIVDVHSVNMVGSGQDDSGCLKVADGNNIGSFEEVLAEYTLYETCDLTPASEKRVITPGRVAVVGVETNVRGSHPQTFSFTVTPFSATQCFGKTVDLHATEELQFLTSPGYPNDFYNNMNCLWKIKSENGNHVVVTIMDIDFYRYPSSHYNPGNQLYIYDGPNESESNLLGSTWGRRGGPVRYTSSGDDLLVKFKSQFNTQDRRGFRISYKTVA